MMYSALTYAVINKHEKPGCSDWSLIDCKVLMWVDCLKKQCTLHSFVIAAPRFFSAAIAGVTMATLTV